MPVVSQYRSGWELSVMLWFDQNPDVKSYQYETIKIPYISCKTKGKEKIRTYFPDFLIELVSGKKILIEVKRKDKLGQSKVKKKIAAALIWCSQNNIEFQIWTDEKIKEIQKELLKKD